MRWLLLVLSMVGFAVAFKSSTPGVLALGLLLAFGALVAAFLAFAAARIEAQSDTQMNRAMTLVATSRGKAGARGTGAAARGGAAGTVGYGDGGTHGSYHFDDDGPDAGGNDGGDSGGGDGGGGGGGD